MHSSDPGEYFRPTCRVRGGRNLPISGCAIVRPWQHCEGETYRCLVFDGFWVDNVFGIPALFTQVMVSGWILSFGSPNQFCPKFSQGIENTHTVVSTEQVSVKVHWCKLCSHRSVLVDCQLSTFVSTSCHGLSHESWTGHFECLYNIIWTLPHSTYTCRNSSCKSLHTQENYL